MSRAAAEPAAANGPIEQDEPNRVERTENLRMKVSITYCSV